MEPIKIHIEKLGRVANSDVTIDRMMLFCGESGMGKSYVAMMCHYFFYVWLHPVRISEFLKEQGLDYDLLRSEMRGAGLAFHVNKSDLETWLATDALRFLGYLLNDEMTSDRIRVTLPSTIPDVLTVNYEETMEGIVNEEDTYVILHSDHLKYRVKDKGINEESPFAVLLRSELLHCVFGNYQALRNYFILPPSRGAILTEKVVPQSGLYKKFEECLSALRTMNSSESPSSAQSSAMLQQLMDGKIGQENDTFFYENESVHIPLTAAASSIREIGVLQLLLEKTSLASDALLIEEPEAHLHPMKQRMMADVIGCFFNAGACMQITTHSDYFLHRVNELLLLGRLRSKYDVETYTELCRQIGESPEIAMSEEGIHVYIVEGRDDGTSNIHQMSLEDGIPFTTFRQVIKLSLDKEDKLTSLLEDEDN